MTEVTITAGGGAPGVYARRVAALAGNELDASFKGVPLGETVRLDAVAEQGWNVVRGDLATPILTLRAGAVDVNIATMQRYCERNAVRLAPHGKTTMSPQLFSAQLDAGAWGMTAATPSQVAVMRRYGVPRILLANELVDPGALRWIAAELGRDPGFEFFCLVDDQATVRAMDASLAAHPPARSLQALIEVGQSGGRGGVRTAEAAVEVARAVRDAEHLELAGVEAFEGALTPGADQDVAATFVGLFATIRASVTAIAALDLFERDDVIVTAGGSMYFDLVIDALGAWPELSQSVGLVLRSGCYVSHDAGAYERQSPLAGRRPPDEDLRLQNALTLWATVLSRPEPDIVIVGAGLRDAPVDRELPIPRESFRHGRLHRRLGTVAESYRVMDQHIFVRITPGLDLRPGDLMAFDLSHPCTAFDKFRFVPLIDEAGEVVDAILTFF